MAINSYERQNPPCPSATIHPIAAQSSGRGPVPDPTEETSVERQQPAPERLVLTVDEAAYLLNISRGLAYELVARGQLPAIRLGRRIVIPRVAMEELLGTVID